MPPAETTSDRPTEEEDRRDVEHVISTERRYTRWLPAAALVAVLALAAACGGGGSKKSATKTTRFPSVATTAFTGDPNKACNLAPKSDVEAAIGAAVRPGVGANGVLCRYDSSAGPSQSVLIESDTTPEASNLFDLRLTSAKAAETLTGVGDRAFVAGNQANVLRGSTVTVVTLTTGQAPAAMTAALKKLAQAVASHT
jgi:hypothetical protein